jgi:hypothetical protein
MSGEDVAREIPRPPTRRIAEGNLSLSLLDNLAVDHEDHPAGGVPNETHPWHD